MRRVFLIISLLCLLPFGMMAQRSSSYDEQLEQLYGPSPLAREIPQSMFNNGKGMNDANLGYGMLIPAETGGAFVNFDITTTLSLNELKTYEGFHFLSAEVVAYNSTTDLVYAYSSDGRFCKIDIQTGEITVIASGVTALTEMAYDVTSHSMYGLLLGVMYSVNLETGAATPVNNHQVGGNNWVAIAINNDGLMYGITNTYSTTYASLYAINTSNWNSYLVGTLPFKTQYTQSMSFNRDTDELYWWQASTGGFNFVRVNPETAQCTAIWPNNQIEMGGLFFKYAPKTYNITYATVEHGTISGPAYAAENDVVEITVTPDYGYRLETLTVNGEPLDITHGAPYTFVMPEGIVNVNATFVLNLHNIIVVDPKDGTLATDPEGEQFYSNPVIVLPTPDPGFGVASITWTADGTPTVITAEPYEFSMPDYDVIVSALYEQTGTNTISIATDYYGYFDDIVTIAVNLENDNYVAGTQTDIVLGDNLTFVPGSVVKGERASGDAWFATSSVLAGNVLRITTANTALGHYDGNNGTIYTFQVACGRVEGINPLTINNPVYGTPDGTNLTMNVVNGSLEIKDVVMGQPDNQVVCHNTLVEEVVFTTTIDPSEGPITYAWTNDNTVIGLAASGTGNIAAFTAVNTTGEVQVAHLTVTPTLIHNGNPCVGSTKEFTITVNPEVIMDVPEDQVLCHNTATEAIEFTTPLTNGTMEYNWTNDHPEIGLAASGNGNIDSFTVSNETNSTIVATIIVTPTLHDNGIDCVGEPISFTITVNPHVVMAQPGNQIVCHGDNTADVIFTTTIEDGTMTYNWTRTNNNIQGLAMEGTGDIMSFVALNETMTAQTTTITVTPTYTNNGIDCVGESLSFTITVNPHVIMDIPDNQVICHEDIIEAVVFTSPLEDGSVSYAWTRTNENIVGLPMSGTTDIPAVALTNETLTAQTTVFTVTPTYHNNGLDCIGESITFTIIVNPHVIMDQPESQVVCHGDNTVSVIFHSPIQDGTIRFGWATDHPEIGLPCLPYGGMNGNIGNIPSFTAVNTTNAAIVANIAVCPVYMNHGLICMGDTLYFSITVNPQVVMDTPANQTLCHGDNTADVIFSTTIVDGTMTYNWTNDTPAIGLEAAGTGDILSFVATNTTNATLVANIVVTPTYTNYGIDCVGEPISFTYTVNPEVVMDPIEDQHICHGTAIEAVEFTTTIEDGTMTYAWTRDNENIGGLEMSGEGNIPAVVLTNLTYTAQTTTIVVTPTYHNNGIDCVGEAISFTIIVNPHVVMDQPESQVVCHGDNTAEVVFNSPIQDGYVNYLWMTDHPEIGLPVLPQVGNAGMYGNIGNIPSFTAVNTTNETIEATIYVVCLYINDLVPCWEDTLTFTITVNPQVVMDTPADQVLCNGDNTADILFNTTITDGTMTYNWTNDNTAIGLAAAGTGDIMSFVAVNNSNAAMVSHIVVTPTYTNNGITCVGEAVNFTITVNPTATMNAVANQTIYSREYTDDIIFSTNVTDGTVTYNWTNDNTAIGLAAAGTGDILSFMGAAPITETQVANITVTPTYDNNGITCVGVSTSFTITVIPTYLVVIHDPIVNGTLTDNARVAANGEHYAPAGEAITLTATPAADYLLENVTVTMLTNNLVVVPVENDQYFTMPAFDVECNATFIDNNNVLIKPAILDLGYRPNNAWMYSKFFNVNNISDSDFEVTHVDLNSSEFFHMDAMELPFTLAPNESAQLGINTNYSYATPGLVSTTMAVIAQQRQAYLRTVVATAYDPVEPDVWELATEVSSFPFTTTQATKGVIYNNYQLPGNKPDGFDGVYEIVVDHDILLNAEITDGDNAKLVVYDEDFRQVGGPHVDNYHGAGTYVMTPYNDIQIGNGTNTFAYAPYYTLYNYSISQQLYKADELHAAGINAGTINSIAFNKVVAGNARNNVTIYMIATDATEIGTTMSLAGQTANYSSSFTPVAGWNEFNFTTPFNWDGVSNIIIACVSNQGTWSTTEYWYAHNPGFYATAYTYTDGSAYTPETSSYSVTRNSSNRLNVRFSGSCAVMTNGIEMGDDPIVDLPLFDGTYYLVASSTSEDSYTLEINAEDMPLPLEPVAIYPAHEAQGIASPVQMEWELGEYTHEYQLIMSLQYPPTEVVVDWTDDLAETYLTDQLLNNHIYFWQINERNSSGMTQGPIWAFTTEMNVPQNLFAEDYELYEGENAVLHWTNVDDRSHRGYNVYQDGVQINNAIVTGNTYTVSGLTYNMEGYIFNVTAVYDEGESDYSNSITIQVSGNGTVSGKVFEQDEVTGIAGVTVTFNGTDEYGVAQTFSFTTNANGSYSGNILAGSYNAIATMEGYQNASYPTTVAIAYNTNTPDIDFVMNETYNPVGLVIAEEIDPSMVHVYWMWEVPFPGMYVDFADGQLPEGWNMTGNWEVTSYTNSSYGFFAGALPEPPFIAINSDDVQTGASGYVTSPVIDAHLVDNLFIEFDHYAYATYGDVCEVQVTTDGSTWTTVEAYTNTTQGSFAAPAHAIIDVTNYASENFQFRFWYTDNGSWLYGWAIDNISLTPGRTAKGGNDRSFAYFNVYRTDCYGQTDVQLLASDITAFEYMDMEWADMEPGVYKWGVSARYEGNRSGLGDLVYDFENNSLAGFDNTSAYPWNITTNAYEGSYAMVSGNAGVNSSTSSIEITVDFPIASSMEFVEKISSESTYDPAYFYIDGVQQFTVSGNGNWTNHMYEVTAGTHTFKWAYTKDSSVGSNDDCWYVDNVIFHSCVNLIPESEIVWSNCLDKDMNTMVDVTVILNSAENPEGVTVAMTNVSEPELDLHYDVTLDETGYYAWDEFRKGEYNVVVSFAGFETITETVTIMDNTSLEYMLVEVLEAVTDLYTSYTGWAMWGGQGPQGPQGPTGNGDEWSYDFENSSMADWTTIDADNDGYNWMLLTDKLSGTGYGHNASNDGVMSQSYDNSYGVLYPDNYLVSKLSHIGSSSTFSFWACGQDASYAAEHFGVAISTASNNNPSDFTTIYEHTIGAKGERYNGIRGDRDQSAWMQYTVDLSAYAGQDVYIAIRHFNCSDEFYLDVDDIALTNGAKNTESVEYYKVMLDGNFDGNTEYNFFQHNVEGFEEDSEHTTAVQAIYSTGVSEWATYNWIYKSCENFAGVVGDVTAEATGADVILNWVFPEGNIPTPPGPGGFDPEWITYTNGTCSTNVGAGGTVYWGSMFPANMLTGYEGGYLTKVAIYANSETSGTFTANIYYGGTSAPGTLVHTQDFTPGTTEQYYEVNLTSALPLDVAQNLWITFYQSGTTYPAAASDDMSGNANNRWASIDGVDWDDLAVLGLPGYEWMIRGYVTSEAKGGELVELPAFRGNVGTELDRTIVKHHGVVRDENTYTFEDGSLNGWTTIDADGDGYTWMNSGDKLGAGYGYAGSQYCVLSQSYDNSVGVLYPDNNLVSPQVTVSNGASISFMVCGQDASYAAEHYGVAVSTSGNTSASDFTTIWEETLSAKNHVAPRGTYDQGTWYQKTIDLSAYAGQTIYVALRHFNCYDEFYIDVDDITINTGNGGGGNGGGMGEGIIGAVIYRDGEYLGFTSQNTYTDLEAAYNAHNYTVRVVYDGPMDGTFWSMSCGDDAEFAGEGCQAPENLEGEYLWTAGNFGAQISWTYAGGEANSFKVYRNGNVVATVSATNATEYEFFDVVAIGTYTYQVTAVTGDCESDFAMTPDMSQNYVSVNVTDVNDYDASVNVYPNPTKGNVKIETSSEMNHITVVTALGQTVYDADINGTSMNLNMAQYKVGVYMVRIYTEDGVSVKRVTVVR